MLERRDTASECWLIACRLDLRGLTASGEGAVKIKDEVVVRRSRFFSNFICMCAHLHCTWTCIHAAVYGLVFTVHSLGGYAHALSLLSRSLTLLSHALSIYIYGRIPWAKDTVEPALEGASIDSIEKCRDVAPGSEVSSLPLRENARPCKAVNTDLCNFRKTWIRKYVCAYVSVYTLSLISMYTLSLTHSLTQSKTHDSGTGWVCALRVCNLLSGVMVEPASDCGSSYISMCTHAHSHTHRERGGRETCAAAAPPIVRSHARTGFWLCIFGCF